MPATIPLIDTTLQKAVMALHSAVPETAMTADLLGTERLGHAIQISEDGLMITAGYSVLEANEILITNHLGNICEGILLAQDFDSGIALIKQSSPLGSGYIEMAPLNSIQAGERLPVITSDDMPLEVEIIAIEEFAGRWEYLLDEGIYTLPLCEHWSGAGLLNASGQLVGIGSLSLGLSENGDDQVTLGNLFIPTELVMSDIEHLALHGEAPGLKRPWLGILAEEINDELHVLGIYHGGPAAIAGIKPGDIIVSVDTQPVASLSGFFRCLWHYGPAGSDIPLILKDDEVCRKVILSTTDRNSFFVHNEANTLN